MYSLCLATISAREREPGTVCSMVMETPIYWTDEWKGQRPRAKRRRLVLGLAVLAGLDLDHVAVGLGAAIADELPGVAHLADHVEVEVGHDDLVLVAAAGGEELAFGVDEV